MLCDMSNSILIPMICKRFFFFSFAFFLALSFFSIQIYSQEKRELSLRECIDLAQKKGPKSKIAKNIFRSKVFTYRSFNSSLLPQILLSGTVPNYEHSITPVLQPEGTKYYELAQ